MNLTAMTIEELEAREQELSNIENPETRSTEDLEAMAKELLDVKAELEARKKAAQEKAEKREQVAADKTTEVRKIEEEKKPMNLTELRASREYSEAYLTALKTGKDEECRALLSANATTATGYVPVPTFLENEIKTAWEENKLLGLVKHSYFKGEVKVAFELSATGATIHLEGAAAPTEEVVTLGVVTIDNKSIKKWITVSDEALEGTTVDTMGYLYKEIAHNIIVYAETLLIAAIKDAPAAPTATAVSVPRIADDTLDVDTVVKLVALLSGQARDLHLVMHRRTYAQLVGIALNANYAVDVFDGLRDRIVFSDLLAVPGDSGIAAGTPYIIVGDFAYGAQINLPNGYDVQIKVDDLSLAEKDLVKLVGRMYCGIGIVSDKSFAMVVKE